MDDLRSRGRLPHARFTGARRRRVRRGASDGGFTLVEVSVAGILAISFILAASAAFGSAFRVTRSNNLREQATAVVSDQLEYVRGLTWSEVAMTTVYTDAPMLNDPGTQLVGSEAGFSGNETLFVQPATGLVYPYGTYEVDGTTYGVWRYVTSGPGGTRRFVVLATWSNEGVDESLVSGTLVSEVTARSNETTTTTTSTTTTSTTSTTLAG